MAGKPDRQYYRSRRREKSGSADGKRSTRYKRRTVLLVILCAEAVAAVVLLVLRPVLLEGSSAAARETAAAAVQSSAFLETIPADYNPDAYAAQNPEQSGGSVAEPAGNGDGSGTDNENPADAGGPDADNGDDAEEAATEAATEAPRQTVTVEKTLYFLGDSRTVGMYRAVTGRNHVTDGTVFDTDSNYYGWAASNGQGLAWAKSTGASFIDGSVGSGCTVVILLGVNDVTGGETEAQAYADYLNQKAAQWKGMGGVETCWVSVNPVNGTINGIDNTKIEDFNQTVRAGLSDDVWYLDTYYELSGQFDTTDRLHYTDETYQAIYDRILQDVMIRYADDGIPVAVEGRS